MTSNPKPTHRILVIDDFDSERVLISEIIEQTITDSFIIETAHNGDEAVRIHDTFRPNLIITDIFMPGMDGFEFMRYLVKTSSKAKIIAMTDRYQAADGINDIYLQMAGALGASRTIFKMDLVRQLPDAIEAMLGIPSYSTRRTSSPPANG